MAIHAGHRDAAEKMVSEALVLTMKASPIHHKGNRHFPHFRQTLWPERARNAVKVYQLLSGCALPGLRRWITPDDGCTGNIFYRRLAKTVAGALWLVDEDYLNATPVRRYGQVFVAPRGNLRVAQSLAAHGSNPLAATCVDGRSAG